MTNWTRWNNKDDTVMAEIRATKDNLFEEISHLIEEARQHVKKAVNTAMVYTYYNIGKHIVENEQHNNQRAAYGKKVLQQLSNKLTDRFGKGWSVETLTKCRKFYCAYSISSEGQTKSQPNEKSSALQTHNRHSALQREKRHTGGTDSAQRCQHLRLCLSTLSA